MKIINIRDCFRLCGLFLGLLGGGQSVLAAQDITRDLVIEAGQRMDNLNWNIAGWTGYGPPVDTRSGKYVNVLSELTWSDLSIQQVGLRFNSERKRTNLRLSASFGRIGSGDNQDSDYDYDDRQGEFSRSNNRATGQVMDVSVAIGRRLELPSSTGRSLNVLPLLGLAMFVQELGMVDGYQTVSVPIAQGLPLVGAGDTDPNDLGPFAGLDSSYKTRWLGAWGGIELWQQVAQTVKWQLGFEVHLSDYYAEANWNLRPDFAHPKSFAHWAEGGGVVANMGLHFDVSKTSFAKLKFEYREFSTGKGTDRIYTTGGATADTELNEVNWDSKALSFGMGMYF